MFNSSPKLIAVLHARVSRVILFLIILLLNTSSTIAQYRFDNWTTENGLPQNSVRGIVQTRDGYIWVATFDGLARFDGIRFTVFNKSNSPGIPSNRFVSIFEDQFGDLWASLEKGGLVRRHQGRFTTYTDSEGLPTTQIHLTGDKDGNLILIVGNQYFRWIQGKLEVANDHRPASLNLPTRVGSISFTKSVLVIGSSSPAQAISRDAAGSLWLVNLDSMKIELLSSQPPEELDYHIVYGDKEGNYWFLTTHGLFRFRKQSVTSYGKPQGLDVQETYPLLETRDGSIWIGTPFSGVFRFKDGSFSKFATDTTISSLYEDRNGQLWINGNSRLVNGRVVRELWGGSPLGPALKFNNTMCQDLAGSFWIGSGAGASRFKDDVLTTYTTHDGLAANDTKVIINDMAGGLWIGGYGGLTHYQDGKFTSWTEKDGLAGNAVRSLRQDSDGVLWIGTYDSGLGRFKDGRFTRFTTRDGLFDSGVFQILEDDYGWIWMSSNRGIYRVRKQELNDFADGRVKTITCVGYNKSDGMPSTECNGGHWPAGIKAHDGKLWFPTMGGVAVIDPSKITTNLKPPPVVIEEMRINNQPVDFERWQSAVTDPNHAIRIEPGQQTFEIQYTALSFIKSEYLRFKYKLEGADQDWVEAGGRRTAYFHHVPPGDYTFKVIAANADGVWNETGASLRITVIPPLWRRWWFITGVVLVVVGVIAAAWKYRVAQLQHVQTAQRTFARQLIASQESERKRIAGELHDSLGQSLVIIRNWALLGASQLQKDAPAKEELDEITSIASRTINEVREIAYDLGPYHLERLGLANSIKDMVTRLVKISDMKITADLDQLNGALSRDAEMNLYRITQEALNNVIKHSQASEARVKLKHERESVRLTISDNGKGFDSSRHFERDSEGPAGFGITGITERVRLLGGELTIKSAPGNGVTILVVLRN